MDTCDVDNYSYMPHIFRNTAEVLKTKDCLFVSHALRVILQTKPGMHSTQLKKLKFEQDMYVIDVK